MCNVMSKSFLLFIIIYFTIIRSFLFSSFIFFGLHLSLSISVDPERNTKPMNSTDIPAELKKVIEEENGAAKQKKKAEELEREMVKMKVIFPFPFSFSFFVFYFFIFLYFI